MKKFERIIELVMLLKESKDMLKKRLKTEFGDILDNDKCDKIVKLNFAGWGRLSRKLLEELKMLVNQLDKNKLFFGK